MAPVGSTRVPSLLTMFLLTLLLGIGVLFIHSASTAGEVAFPGTYAKAQLMRIAAGVAIFLVFLRLDYRRLEEWATPLYLFGVVLLIILVALKVVRTEPSRWFYLPGFALQPAELMKIFAVLLLAKVLKPSSLTKNSPAHEFLPFVVIGVPVLLIILQPDLGTALVLVPVFFAMYWASGARTSRVVGIIGTLVALLPIAWLGLHPYQKTRLSVFWDPAGADVTSGGYQIRQSLIAIGNGGATGRGLYQGTQNRLDYLPEDHNDFVFAIIGEETGLVGTLVVIGIFFSLFVSCAGIAMRTQEFFGRLVVIGLTTYLAFQTVINLAMTMGLAPVTGLPLPFVSYGGSSLLTSLMSIAIILGIGLRPVRTVAPDGLQSGTSPIVHLGRTRR